MFARLCCWLKQKSEKRRESDSNMTRYMVLCEAREKILAIWHMDFSRVFLDLEGVMVVAEYKYAPRTAWCHDIASTCLRIA